MAFVSEDCIKEWQTKTSWVYINFTYLFQNKLWVKRIPTGFSLCPYFWMALFSMLVFKPILEPLIILAGKALKITFKIGGAPILWWDNFVRSKMSGNVIPNGVKGAGLVFTFIIFLMVLICSLALFCIRQFYINISSVGSQWTALFWWFVINIGCLIPIRIYLFNHRHKLKDDRCGVEWYGLICFLITTIFLNAMYPSMVGEGLSNITSVFIAILLIFGEIFKFIGHNLAIAGIYVGKYGWLGLKFFGQILFIALSVLIPVIVICAILGGLGLLLMKIFDKGNKEKAIEINKVRKVQIDDWRDLLDFMYSEEKWIDLIRDGAVFPRNTYEYFSYEYFSLKYNPYVDIECSMAKKMISHVVSKTVIPDVLLNMPYSDFEAIKKHVYSSYSLVFNKLKEVSIAHIFLQYSEKMNAEIASACSNLCKGIEYTFVGRGNMYTILTKEFKKEYDERVEEANKMLSNRLAIFNKENELKEARKKKHEQYCKMLSTPIAKFFMSIVNGIRHTCSLIFIKLIWTIIIKKGIWFTLRQIGIFFVHLWVVAKHLKHGACPYLQFIDPPVDGQTTEEKGIVNGK